MIPDPNCFCEQCEYTRLELKQRREEKHIPLKNDSEKLDRIVSLLEEIVSLLNEQNRPVAIFSYDIDKDGELVKSNSSWWIEK